MAHHLRLSASPGVFDSSLVNSTGPPVDGQLFIGTPCFARASSSSTRLGASTITTLYLAVTFTTRLSGPKCETYRSTARSEKLPELPKLHGEKGAKPQTRRLAGDIERRTRHHGFLQHNILCLLVREIRLGIVCNTFRTWNANMRSGKLVNWSTYSSWSMSSLPLSIISPRNTT